MNDPRRLREEDSLPQPMRDLLASTSPPEGLPHGIRARGLQAVRSRRARRRRQRTSLVAGLLSAALLLLALALWQGQPQITAEREDSSGKTSEHSADATRTLRSPASAPVVDGPFPYLVPQPSGWLNRRSNPWGAQGAFYVDASPGSTVLEPARPEGPREEGWMWRNEGDGRLCLKGSSAGIQEGDFKKRWGVVAGIELCRPAADEDFSERPFSITECPWGNLVDLRGVRFELEGPDIPSQMRVVFSEVDSRENAFVAVYDASGGPQEIALDDARVSYQQPPRAARRERVRGVEWLIPSRLSEPAAFDFCLKNIALF